MRKVGNGFTMIEIMIVLAIIGGAVVMALPYITSRNTQTRKFLREFTVLSRELHTKAKLNGVVYRLVIEMPPPKTGDDHPGQKFWVEKSNSKLVISKDEEELTKERLGERDPEKRKDPKGFEVDTQVIKEPRDLPRGLYFEEIELTRLPNPVKQGRAYIHYLPQGLVDEAAVHIKGVGNQAWTVAIHPLTGRAELIPKPTPLKEIKSQ
jgi:general secretion pathway protein H